MDEQSRAIDMLVYGLYALVNTGRVTEEQIQPTIKWLESAEKCVNNSWDEQ